MEDKIFTKLQQKFFYIPLVIGWVLVVLACSLIFYITYEKTMTKVQSNLLKASDAPYFQSDNFLYIFDKNGSLTVSQLENAYTESEIEEITVFLKAETDNKFTIKSGKHFMYVKSSSVDDGITTVKYVIIEYTDDMETLTALAITLIVLGFAALLGIFLFCYFYSKSTIAPVKASFIQQQELIANASHELKTPLTIVRTNLDLITSDPDSTVKDNEKWLNSTVEQVNRMNTMILDMLELSRIDAGKASRYMRLPVVLNDCLQGTLLSFEAPCYEKNITLEFIAREKATVLASNEEIEKLSTILLDNAIKYTPDNGKITVKIQRVKQRRAVQLSFTNTGAGIPEEHLERIFDRFYKVDPSHKETHNSFGLGLSIAKSLVVSLKGSIKCESKLGEYTSFIIELPLSLSSGVSTGNKKNN